MTVDRKSAAWCSDVVRDVSSAKSSAADRVISAALRLFPIRLLSPPARSLGTSQSGPNESVRASAADIAAAISRPPAKCINWVTFTGGVDRLPRRGKGPGLGLGLAGRIPSAGGGTGQGDEETDGSTSGSSFAVKKFAVKKSDGSTSGISSSA